MITQYLGILILFFAGVFGLFPQKFSSLKRGGLLLFPLISTLSFLKLYFSGKVVTGVLDIIESYCVNLNISLEITKESAFICMVVCLILFVVVLSVVSNEKKGTSSVGLLSILNVFAGVMCVCICSADVFTFFLCIEVIGYISSIMVGLSDKNASVQFSRVLFFNRLSGLLFLVASYMMVDICDASDFSAIRSVVEANEIDVKKLMIPAWIFFISCVCKSAQFPFSYWLISATKANVFASVFIHTATVLCVGVIFISKVSFIFDMFYIIKKFMIGVGLLTGILMGIGSISHVDIKKIMACSSCAYVGLMFISCGIGEYSVSRLSFICHAFFKSLVFISFVYVMYAMFLERNIKNMGGINTLIPKIKNAVLAAGISSIGFPFLISFFSKHELFLCLWGKSNVVVFLIYSIINILLIISIFRLISVAIYGDGSDKDAHSRVTDISVLKIFPFWLLFLCSVVLSFLSWKTIGDAVISKDMIISKDFLYSCIFEFGLILISAVLFFKFRNKFKSEKLFNFFQDAIKKNMISELCLNNIYLMFSKFFRYIKWIDNNINFMISSILVNKVLNMSKAICNMHRVVFSNHVLLYSVFMAVVAVFYVLVRIFLSK